METYRPASYMLEPSGKSDSLGAPRSKQVSTPNTETAVAIAHYNERLLPPGRPRRLARMSTPGEMKQVYNKKTQRWETIARGKYEDVPKVSFEQALHTHAQGIATYSSTVDTEGLARCGAIDIDDGLEWSVKFLTAATQLQLRSYFIFMETPGGHSGGHLRVEYDQLCPIADIKAQLRSLAQSAGREDWETLEIWPSTNQGIRWTFGVHQLANSRGRLLTSAGLIFDLDDSTELGQAVAYVTHLRPNVPPPPAPVKAPILPTQPPSFRRLPLGEQAAEGLSVREAIDRFNQTHPLTDLLVQYRAEEIGTNYFSCPCGVQHTHDSTLYISRQGKLFSLSPRCKWHTTKGWDSFGLFCLVEHNDDTGAALKAINPRPMRAQKPPFIEPPEYITSKAAEARRRDKERHQRTRQIETTAILHAARARMYDNSLKQGAVDLLVDLLELAGNVRQVIVTNKVLAHKRGKSERTVERAFGDLKRAGIGVRHGGRFVPGHPELNEPAVWTFTIGCAEDDSALIAPAFALGAPEDDRCTQSPTGALGRDEGDSAPASPPAPVTLVDHKTYLDSKVASCEPRATAPTPSNHCHSDGQALEQCAVIDILPVNIEVDVDRDRLSHVRALARKIGGAALLLDHAEMLPPELEESIAALTAEIAHMHAPAIDERVLHGPDGAFCYPGGAAYLPTPAAELWWESLPQPTLTPQHDEVEELVSQAFDTDSRPPPPPQSRWNPPSDPQDAEKYYKLLNKARRVVQTNPGQAAALRNLAYKYEELCVT